MSYGALRRRTPLRHFTGQIGLSFRTMGKKGPKKAPAPKRPPLTHFLCVPLITETSRLLFEASLKRFTKTLSDKDSEAKLPIIPHKAIRPVGALHLTLGVMSLDEGKLAEAVDCLKGDEVVLLINNTIDRGGPAENAMSNASEQSTSVERPISPPLASRSRGPIEVQLKGLESMHPPKKTSILYTAPTDDTERLYPLCVAVQKVFKDKGLLIEDNRQLKLHATVVNTIYAKGKKRPARRDPKQSTNNANEDQSTSVEPVEEAAATRRSLEGGNDRSQGHGPNADAFLRMDATDLLEKSKDFVWAENVVLNRIAICEMGARKIFDGDGNEIGGEYTEVASTSLLG